jgi:hypothetical protein
VQSKITDNNVLRISSGKATQWCFIQGGHGGSIERLAAEIRGKIHIDISPATQLSEGK